METKYDESVPRHATEKKSSDDDYDFEEKEDSGWDNERKNEETALTVQSSIFGSDGIVQRLVDYWSSKLTDDISMFLDKHVDKFEEEELNTGEHRLEYSRIHKKYEDLVESHLHAFTETEGISYSDLFNRLRSAGRENDLANMIIQLVLSCVDYSSFIEIMHNRVRHHNTKKNLLQTESKLPHD